MTISYKKSRNSGYYTDCMRNAEGKLPKSTDDYYTAGGKEPPGTWHVFSQDGATEALGIVDGQVFRATEEVLPPLKEGDAPEKFVLQNDVEKFTLLMDGYDPSSGRALVQGAGTEKRIRLHDFVLSPPKSYSVAWGLADESLREQLGRLNSDASHYAISDIIGHTQTREGKGGEVKKTAHTVLAAKFQHGSSRENDMQLHEHWTIANVGITKEGNSTALEMREALRRQGVAGCKHSAYLAWGARKMGFAVEVNDKNFEIKGVPENVIEHFSTRRRRIVNAFDLTRAGFTLDQVKIAIKTIADVEYAAVQQDLNADEKSELWLSEGERRGFSEEQIAQIREVSGLSSNLAKRGFSPAEIRATYGVMSTIASEIRDQKNELTRAQLIKLWNERGAAIGFTVAQIDEIRNLVEGESIEELGQEEMLEQIRDAVKEIHETDAVFTEETLLVATLTKLMGQASPESIVKATELYKQRELVQSHKLDKGVDRQFFSTRQMLAIESRMMELTRQSRGDHNHILQNVEIDSRLREEQVKALLHVTKDQGSVSVIEGTAGAGKTFTARAVAEQYKKAGYEVVGLAGGWKQAINLQVEAGLEDGRAITGWLNGVRRGTIKLDSKTLVLLDEAGMVGAHQMKDVLEVTNAAGAKLILLGDTKQQKSVAAGDPMRHIVDELGSIRLDEITRQVDLGDREAIKALFRGGYIVEGGKIVSEKENGTRAGLTHFLNKGNIVIEKDLEATHDRLIADWLQTKTEHRAWAEANLHNADEKIRKNAERVLDSVHDEALIIAGDNKSVKDLNERAHAARLAAGELGEECLALRTIDTTQDNPMQTIHVGELVAFRKTVEVTGKDGQAKKISNRELAKVTGIVGERLILLTESGTIVDFDTTSKEWQDKDGVVQIQYGYCSTVHAAQGLTVDYVFCKDGLSMTASSGGVGASRHRLNCKFYVDKSVHYEAFLSKSAAEEWKPEQEFSHEEVFESMVKYWSRQVEKNSTLDFNEWRTMQGAHVNTLSENQIAEIKRSFEEANQEIARIQQESKIQGAPVHKELPFQQDKSYQVEAPQFTMNDATKQSIIELEQDHKVDIGSVNAAVKDKSITFRQDGQPVIIARKQDGTPVATYDLQGNRLEEGKALSERYAPVLSGDPNRVDIVKDGLDALKLRSSQIEEKDRTTIIVSGGKDEALGMPHIREKIEQAKEVRRFDREEVAAQKEISAHKELNAPAKEKSETVGQEKEDAKRESQAPQAAAEAQRSERQQHQAVQQQAPAPQPTPPQPQQPKIQQPQAQQQAKPQVQVHPRQEIDRMAGQAAAQRAVQAPQQVPQQQAERARAR